MSFLVRAREFHFTLGVFVSDVISTLSTCLLSLALIAGGIHWETTTKTPHARPACRRGVFLPRLVRRGIQRRRQSAPSVAVRAAQSLYPHAEVSYLGGLAPLSLFVAVWLEEEIQAHYL